MTNKEKINLIILYDLWKDLLKNNELNGKDIVINSLNDEIDFLNEDLKIKEIKIMEENK